MHSVQKEIKKLVVCENKMIFSNFGSQTFFYEPESLKVFTSHSKFNLGLNDLFKGASSSDQP